MFGTSWISAACSLVIDLYVSDIFPSSGDDWEHEEIFTDDDEAVGNDPEEREDLAPEIPAPPEIKQVQVGNI